MRLRCLCFFLLCASLCVSGGEACAAQKFDMEQAVLHALKSNPSVESASLAAEAAEAGRKAARSAFGPSVSASYEFDRFNKDRPSRSERNAASLTVRLSQPLFTGWQLLNEYQKARLQEEYQQIRLASQRLSTALQVQQAFLSHVKAQESIRSGKRRLERARNQLAMAKTAWEIGLKPRLDMLQAEVEVSRAETALIRYENERDVFHDRLNSLLDIQPGADAEYLGRLDIHPFRRTLEDCLAKTLEWCPNLLLARKSAEIAAADLGIAKSQFWPKVSAVLGWTTSGSHIGADGGKYAKKDYSYAHVGLAINWTLFTSGQRLHLTRQAQRQVAAMEAAVRTAVNESAYTVRSCLFSAQDAYRTVKVAEKSVSSSRESYADAKMRYEVQSGTYLELLTAQSALSEAELAEISARAECLLSLARLYEAMGELHPGLREGKTIP
ncbi:MAG: TolC family protein [Mailhella sp.]|nr:TolC family protein [Mailhella sp.]